MNSTKIIQSKYTSDIHINLNFACKKDKIVPGIHLYISVSFKHLFLNLSFTNIYLFKGGISIVKINFKDIRKQAHFSNLKVRSLFLQS